MWAWIILIVSGVFEAVWATALGKSEGFTKLWPTVVFAVGCAISMGGLALALRLNRRGDFGEGRLGGAGLRLHVGLSLV